MLFRFDRNPKALSFPTNMGAQRRLRRFSFEANTFVHALSTYVTDSAIGANHKSFTDRLLKLRHGVSEHQHSDSDDEAPPEELLDVFSILKYHSAVLDRILEACFLKARHRAMGGTSMVECFNVILQLGQLVTDVRSGVVPQDTGARRLGRLHDHFHASLQDMVSIRHVCLVTP